MNKLLRFELHFWNYRFPHPFSFCLDSFAFPSLFILFILSVIALSACSTGELSRSQAKSMIIESDDFKQPAMLEYNQLYIADGEGIMVAKSDNESEEETIKRRISEYFWEVPQVAVANHFGLVEPQLTRKNDKPVYPSQLRGYWHFNERYVATDKGKKMWEEIGFSPSETSIPIAQREFIGEVTGITKQGEVNVLVEFKWRWKPNEVGKSLDTTTDEFKQLPEKIRKDLVEPNIYVSQERTRSWGNERLGKAMFQKYDDGWRLISVGLF
jgi:hypothetical protein